MDLFRILLAVMHLHFREIHILERLFQRLPKIRLKEFLIKTQVHENKNAASEMIYSHCGPCLLLSASLPSSAWKKASWCNFLYYNGVKVFIKSHIFLFNLYTRYFQINPYPCGKVRKSCENERGITLTIY